MFRWFGAARGLLPKRRMPAIGDLLERPDRHLALQAGITGG
jgi:hypothetical protein